MAGGPFKFRPRHFLKPNAPGRWASRLLALTVLLAVSFLTGCASRYQITLNNHAVITTRGKPKIVEDSGMCYYKDAEGKPGSIPIIRIKSIEPIYRWDPEANQPAGLPVAE